MGCCNKRNKKSQKLDKKDKIGFTSLDQAREMMLNMVNFAEKKSLKNYLNQT